MPVFIIPAPPKMPEAVKPIVLDCTLDYNEVAGLFFARDDIDHKVDITPGQALIVNTETGEITTKII